MSYNIRITYFGIIRSITSWAKVAREILKGLIKNGIEISIYETKGFLYDKNFNLELLEKYVSHKTYDIIFTFEHPLKYYMLPKSSFKIGFLVYEFTHLPQSWIENINKYLDMVLVPSTFTYNVFINSGIKKEKIKILRYGYNPNYYYPTKKTNKINNFLTVSSPHKRESLDILLEAFTKAFKDNNNVRLTVKLSYSQFKKNKNFEIPSFNKLIEKYQKILNSKLKIITDKLSEEDMGNLYRNSDIYISLSKAESFGLPFLESLACGRPVVSLKYGGQLDFLNDKNTVFIKHVLKETQDELYEKTKEKQFVAYPEINDCIEKLKIIYNKGF
ncbi:MAG: glycosyltransferase, partial [Elusimicrobiales bacterium]|nr:glycosyltransferase [Elusimicrobiales bacterium]